MRKLTMLAAAIAALAIPAVSHAQFTLGARLGYGLAMGDAEKDFGMSDFVKSQIPIQIDAMYRVTPDFALGAYFSYGFAQTGGFTADLCDLPGADCSVSSLRIGVQGTYAFSKASPQFVPWVGAGIGWESVSFDAGGGSTDVTGFEFLNLQGGAAFKVSPQFQVGPYAQLAISQFSSADGNDIPDKAMHQWLSFGVRGSFDF